MFASENAQQLIGDKRLLLRAVLDCLLPPNGELPGAGGLDLDKQVEIEATLFPDHGLAMHSILGSLTPGFLNMPGETQVEALRNIEAAQPGAFSILVLMAYNAYYTDQRVLEQIQQETGYEARPPQPKGYELKPFDVAMLAKVKLRQPFYRKT